MFTFGILAIVILAALFVPNYRRYKQQKIKQSVIAEKEHSEQPNKQLVPVRTHKQVLEKSEEYEIVGNRNELSPERYAEIEAIADELLKNDSLFVRVPPCGWAGCTGERSIYASIPSEFLFPENPTTISPDNWNELSLIAKLAKDMNLQLTIQGNANEDLVEGTGLKSTWELSALRAAKIADLFVEKSSVDPKQIIVQGRGHHVPECDENIDDSAECHNKNNRVNIAIDQTIETSKSEWKALLRLVESNGLK